ncbi:MAG TPA: fumarylacetoacetate hydrolase family protein [Trebonia sp.]
MGVHLYRTAKGLARRDGDELVLLDLPYGDVGALLAAGIGLASGAGELGRVPLGEATVLSPIEQPAHLVLNGLLYAGHIAEAGQPTPTSPAFILANGGALDAPGAPIVLPPGASGQVDYEGEVALVIGRATAGVTAREAWDCVAGLTIVNDVSERREQLAAMGGESWDVAPMVRSKRHPGFKPCGPALVTTDEFGENPDLEIETRLNGVLVQHDWTRNMIFRFTEIVAAVSAEMALSAGDVICTGTPAGVALSTGRYLADGDVVDITVEGIGTLSNPVTARPFVQEARGQR